MKNENGMHLSWFTDYLVILGFFFFFFSFQFCIFPSFPGKPEVKAEQPKILNDNAKSGKPDGGLVKPKPKGKPDVEDDEDDDDSDDDDEDESDEEDEDEVGCWGTYRMIWKCFQFREVLFWSITFLLFDDSPKTDIYQWFSTVNLYYDNYCNILKIIGMM